MAAGKEQIFPTYADSLGGSLERSMYTYWTGTLADSERFGDLASLFLRPN